MTERFQETSEISAVLIAGPTASGKSALALRFAAELGGTILNADSMQVYRGIPLLSAQPLEEDRAQAPHLLYGHVDPASDYSVGIWMREARDAIRDVAAAGRVPIVVGGTGLYFRALLGGIDEMPTVPPSLRAAWRERMAAEGPLALHAELRRRDPVAASRIRPSDPQRIVRALELVETAGRPLDTKQAMKGEPVVEPERVRKIVLTPERSVLRDRIARRFEGMIEAGAVEEARRFKALGLPADLPANKAIGLVELGAFLDGRVGFEEAVRRAVTRSRQYAKRQETWFRHQCDATWERHATDAGLRVR